MEIYNWCISIIVQRDTTQSSLFIILRVHSTCFLCRPHPSSGVHNTVTTASGTGHISCAATNLITLEGSNCTVPEAIVTVLCTPDDGCGWHPKYIEWTFFFFPKPHVLLVDFVVLPPGHGRNVTDFWVWDAHEAQLPCPDGVWVVI